MKRPTKPVRPHQPSKPKEYLYSKPEYCSVYDGSTLAKILEATKGVAPESVCFTSVRGYYDDYDYRFEWNEPQKPNPQYEKQMAEYLKKMNKFHKDVSKYNEKLVEYHILSKEYKKWFYAEQLKKLG